MFDGNIYLKEVPLTNDNTLCLAMVSVLRETGSRSIMCVVYACMFVVQ